MACPDVPSPAASSACARRTCSIAAASRASSSLVSMESRSSVETSTRRHCRVWRSRHAAGSSGRPRRSQAAEPARRANGCSARPVSILPRPSDHQLPEPRTGPIRRRIHGIHLCGGWTGFVFRGRVRAGRCWSRPRPLKTQSRSAACRVPGDQQGWKARPGRSRRPRRSVGSWPESPAVPGCSPGSGRPPGAPPGAGRGLGPAGQAVAVRAPMSSPDVACPCRCSFRPRPPTGP